METLLFVALIGAVVAAAVIAARRPGRSAVRRRYDYDVGPETPHGDGGPTAGASFDSFDGHRGGSDGGGFSGGGDGGGGGGGGGGS